MHLFSFRKLFVTCIFSEKSTHLCCCTMEKHQLRSGNIQCILEIFEGTCKPDERSNQVVKEWLKCNYDIERFGV